MTLRILLLTALAMLAFAANSLLTRLALRDAGIDAASFMVIRVVSAALLLVLLVRLRPARKAIGGNWKSGLSLLAYAVFFTFAYVNLPAATGALLLFGAVQVTMILRGLASGERFSPAQVLGLLMAMGGIVWLLLPGVSAPPLFEAGLMIIAGIAWGVYSLLGRGKADPLAETAGNFLRAAPLALLCAVPFAQEVRLPVEGVVYALLSGAIASGLGYAIWYAALRGLAATQAATVQLSVPVLTALISIPLLGEALTSRLVIVSLLVLGGIALVILTRRPLRKPA